MDAETWITASGDMDFDTETLHFCTSAAIVEQDYNVTREGFIFGVESNVVNIGVSINTPLPASTSPNVTEILTGLVILLAGGGANIWHLGRWPIKIGDIIRVKQYSAATSVVQLVLGYRRA